MKKIMNTLAGMSVLLLALVISCKKDAIQQASGTVTAEEYTYNTVTKKLTPNTSITGEITSAAGIKLVYYYLQRNNTTDSLVYVSNTSGESNYTFNIPVDVFDQADMTQANGIKVAVKDNNNQSFEGLVKLNAFTPELPKLEDFPETLLPDVGGAPANITGKISASSGLKQIDIYDDYQGTFALVHSITGLNNAQTYNFDYDYTYRPNAKHLTIVATDSFDLHSEIVINMPVAPYTTYENVVMDAQSTGNSTIFFENTGATGGNCDISASEATMAFLFYGSSSAPTFYSPTNTANVAKNYKCSGTSWTIADASVLRATRFRVLVPGSTGTDNIYALYNSNGIPALDDSFFKDNSIAAPSGNTAKYDASVTSSTSTFDVTNAYLIYVRIPDADGGTTHKNALIRVKEVVSNGGSSTVKFDILVQK